MAFRLGVDVGGTFTDLFLVGDEGSGAQYRVKTPSTPADPSEGVLVGVRRICEESGVAVGDLRNILHGTTVATNAVLESKGARVGLITTQGFAQILHLARSQTPGPLAGWIIMIKPDPPASLADTREAVEGWAARRDRRRGRREAGRGNRPRPRRVGRRVAHRRPDQLVRQPGPRGADRGDRRAPLPGLPGDALRARPAGVPRVRADADGVHELLRPAQGRDVHRRAAEALKDRRHRRREHPPLGRRPDDDDGGGAEPDLRDPLRPSGGVAGALYVARKAGFDDILTFDMGGTSTDVALCQNGEPTIGRETSISHFRIKVPSVNVHTVGAGGGSIAHVPELTKALRVGPQSAGADPGPASYGRGGQEPTVTDANVVLGHLPPRLLGGEMELDAEAARASVQTIADAMGSARPRQPRGSSRS